MAGLSCKMSLLHWPSPFLLRERILLVRMPRCRKLTFTIPYRRTNWVVLPGITFGRTFRRPAVPQMDLFDTSKEKTIWLKSRRKEELASDTLANFGRGMVRLKYESERCDDHSRISFPNRRRIRLFGSQKLLSILSTWSYAHHASWFVHILDLHNFVHGNSWQQCKD